MVRVAELSTIQTAICSVSVELQSGDREQHDVVESGRTTLGATVAISASRELLRPKQPRRLPWPVAGPRVWDFAHFQARPELWVAGVQ